MVAEVPRSDEGDGDVRETNDKRSDRPSGGTSESADQPPIEDQFDIREDDVDFESAESFPASDPPAAQKSPPEDDSPASSG